MTTTKRWLALGLAVLLTAAVCSSGVIDRTESKAPELREISGWINSEPLSIEQLQGKVVLVDFWTYTCVNCIRTFPFLNEWHRKYADSGLVILSKRKADRILTWQRIIETSAEGDVVTGKVTQKVPNDFPQAGSVSLRD